MPDRTKIEDRAKLTARVADLDGWVLDGDAITRTLEFDGFLEAVEFIQAIAPLAEELDHHPEIFNVYNRVELTLNTHDVGGLTEFDFELAARIDEVAARDF